MDKEETGVTVSEPPENLPGADPDSPIAESSGNTGFAELGEEDPEPNSESTLEDSEKSSPDHAPEDSEEYDSDNVLDDPEIEDMPSGELAGSEYGPDDTESFANVDDELEEESEEDGSNSIEREEAGKEAEKEIKGEQEDKLRGFREKREAMRKQFSQNVRSGIYAKLRRMTTDGKKSGIERNGEILNGSVGSLLKLRTKKAQEEKRLKELEEAGGKGKEEERKEKEKDQKEVIRDLNHEIRQEEKRMEQIQSVFRGYFASLKQTGVFDEVPIRKDKSIEEEIQDYLNYYSFYSSLCNSIDKAEKAWNIEDQKKKEKEAKRCGA